MAYSLILWAIFVSALIHTYEEYRGGFIEFIIEFSPFKSVLNKVQFWIINSVFISMCFLAAMISDRLLVVSLAIPFAVFINALLHLGASIMKRRYTAGLLTALGLYLALSILAFYSVEATGLASADTQLESATLAIVGYAVLVLYLALSSRSVLPLQ